jgi:hypothetical protein
MTAQNTAQSWDDATSHTRLTPLRSKISAAGNEPVVSGATMAENGRFGALLPPSASHIGDSNVERWARATLGAAGDLG